MYSQFLYLFLFDFTISMQHIFETHIVLGFNVNEKEHALNNQI